MSVSGSVGLATTAMTEATQDDTTMAANVSERKFNGTATLKITATNERAAEAAAREYFRDTHGSDPSKVVVQVDDGYVIRDGDEERYEVMVADHSSGSLADSAQYDFGGDGA